MNNIRLTTALFAAAIGMVAVAPKASADAWDKKTIVTFSGPVEVPGAVLTPGTYVFKLVDSQSDRHIVTIQNERQNHTYATILAIPDYRVRPTSKTVFTFWEVPAGQPQAIKEWFYPADNFGQEFVYHKKFTQVSQVTKQEQAPPPAVAEEKKSEAAETEVAQNEPAPPPPAAEAPAAAPEPAPAPEQPATVAENRPPKVIPQTAGNLPLLALLGFGSIGLALGVGALTRRTG